MANRKDSQKLKVPAKFKLESYRNLKNWSEPRFWLEQFALRVDIGRLIERVQIERGEGSGLLVDEFYLEEMIEAHWDAPLEPASAFIDYFSRGGLTFPALRKVFDGFSPIAPMTVADLYIAECGLDPSSRSWGRAFGDRVRREAPFPNEELRCAEIAEDSDLERVGRMPDDALPSEILREQYSVHLRKTIANVKDCDLQRNPELGLYAPHMDARVQDALGHDSFLYLTVDTNAPYKVAEAAFKKLFEARQLKSRYRKQVDWALFAKWCDDGVLPYIDLLLYQRFEAMKSRDDQLAISEADFADAIYPPHLERSQTSVSDTTRPMAEQLLDEDSPLFLSLLAQFSGPE